MHAASSCQPCRTCCSPRLLLVFEWVLPGRLWTPTVKPWCMPACAIAAVTCVFTAETGYSPLLLLVVVGVVPGRVCRAALKPWCMPWCRA